MQHDESMTEGLDLLRELEPAAEAALERHLRLAKEWMPHEYVPWGRARDFVDEPWEAGQSTLSPIAQIAFEVNLLTEDNLPSYHREITTAFGRDGAWGTWAQPLDGRGRPPLRCACATSCWSPAGSIPSSSSAGGCGSSSSHYDSRGRGRGRQDAARSDRVRQLPGARDPDQPPQHRRLHAGPARREALARVAADENLHMIFYRDLMVRRWS